MALDDDNPFATGADAGGGAADTTPSEGTLEAVPMDVGAILSRCWEIFSANPGLVIGALLIPLVPAIAFGGMDAVFQLMAEGADENAALAYTGASLAVNIANYVVALFFQLGMIRIFLNLARGSDAELGMLVGEGGSYLGGLGASILVGLAVMVGLLLLIVPGIIVAVGLQFYLYALLDKNLDPVAALQESWRLTDGYKMTIFLINFVIAIGALILTCVTLGLGYLLAVPVLSLTQAVMYHSLTHLQADHAY